jgi:hypothetical protein
VRENADGRSRPIALTAAGKELLLKAEPAWSAAEVEATALLGPDGMMTIIGVADRFANATGIPPTEGQDTTSDMHEAALINSAGRYRLRLP